MVCVRCGDDRDRDSFIPSSCQAMVEAVQLPRALVASIWLLGHVCGLPPLHETLRTEKLADMGPQDCYVAEALNSSGSEYHFCAPSIIVAGFPKCGTSFLFKSLAAHPSIRPTRRKEMCLGGVKAETWDLFLRNLVVDSSPGALSSGMRTLSGCLHLGANVEVASALATQKTKYVFAVRHVADMLWAAYNYWCIPGLDSGCKPGQRTTSGHVRTPADFHARILDWRPMGGGINIGTGGNCYKPLIKRAVSAFGKDMVIVVRSEDFLPTLDSMIRKENLRQLLAALDLDVAGEYEDQYVASSKLVNSGHRYSSRGEFVAVALDTPSQYHTYEASLFQEMLHETRQLLESRWESERQWLKKYFGLRYENYNHTK